MSEEPDLPEGWAWARLADLASQQRNAFTIGPFGSSLKVSDYREAGVPLVFVRDIRAERFGGPNTKYVSPQKAKELAAHVVRPGDLLVTKMGEPPGDPAIYPAGRPTAIVTADCIKLTPEASLTSSAFLRLSIRSPVVREQIGEQTMGVAQQKLSLTRFKEVRTPLPPIPEQHRIVEKVEALLGQVNRVKERLDRVPLILKRFRQALLAAACSGELTKEWRTAQPASRRPSPPRPAPSNDLPDYREHLDGQDFPQSWELVRVDRLTAIQNGRAFPSKEYMDRGGVRLLRPGNLHIRGVVEWTDDNTVSLPKKWMTEFPDFVLGERELLMNLTAQSLKDEFLGRACIKSDPEPALLNQRIARLTPLGDYDVRRYLLAYFKSKFFRHHVNGLDTGSLIRHMHSKDVARHVVPLPPEDEQVEILALVGKLMALAETIERRVQAADSRAAKLPQAILSRAFSGELVPTEAELARIDGRTYETAEELLRPLEAEPTAPRSKRTQRRARRVGEDVEA